MPLAEVEGRLQLESITFKSTKRKQELIDQVRQHFSDGVSARGDWPTRHDGHYRRYLSDYTLRDQGPWPNAPRLFTSHTRRTLETVHAQLLKAVFPGFESLSLTPFQERDIEHLDTATKTLRWTLHHLVNEQELGGWAGISYTALFEALLDGTGFLKVTPWMPPWQGADPDVIVRIDNIDEGTLLFPSDARGVQYPEAAFFGQELFVRWDDLVRKRAQGYHVPAKKDMPAGSKPLTEYEETQQQRDGRSSTAGHDVGDEYQVAELYERFAVEDEEDVERDVVVSFYPTMDGDKDDPLARVVYLEDLFPHQPRPMRPFFGIRVWPQPRQLRGLNLPDRARTPQDMINRLAEQMVNYGDVSILPFFFYNALITGDIPSLRQVQPGEGVPVNDLGGIQQVQRASLNQHFLSMSQYWGSEIEGDMHVSDFQQGRSPTRPNAPRTLGATMLILQAGREAFKIIVDLLKSQFEQTLQFQWNLWQYYMPATLQVPLRQAPRRSQPTPGAGQGGGFFDMLRPFQAFQQGQAGPPGGNGAALGQPPLVDPAGQQADQLLEPMEGHLLAEDVHRDQIAGGYRVAMRVNPDLPFDRQVLSQLGMQMYPLIKAVYPIGARLLLKNIWNIHGQDGFDMYYPSLVAVMETQALFAQVLQQTMARMQPQGQQPQQPQGPSPQVQQAQDQAAMHGAQHTMQRNELQTQQQVIQMLQQVQKLIMAGQGNQNGAE